MEVDDKQRTAIEMLLADYDTTSSPGAVLAIGQGSDVLNLNRNQQWSYLTSL
ncbi:MAG: hypothetical protein OSA83_18810 [Pseudomonadales bacterium]|nr:hypothetical protein [Gammaproteobacteria bacterium]MDE0991267.1 hypothetical protein [Pseudomonadales bacterium]